jgi:hypothetical protein
MKPDAANTESPTSFPCAVEHRQTHAAERREQHREVERERTDGAVDLLVVHQVRRHLRDVCLQDRLDATFCEQRRHPLFAGDLAAVHVEGHPADAEVAELVLVRQVDQPGTIAHPRLAQRVIDVEHVLERSTLACARAVPHADDECLRAPRPQVFDGVSKRGRRLRGVSGRADRQGVALRAEARCQVEAELEDRSR